MYIDIRTLVHRGPIIGVLPNWYSNSLQRGQIGICFCFNIVSCAFLLIKSMIYAVTWQAVRFFSNQVITAINPNLRKVGKYYYCWFICCPVSICSPNVFLIYHSFWINSKPLVAKLINVMPYVTFTSSNPLTWNTYHQMNQLYISLYTEKTLIDTSQHGVIFPGSGISKAPFRCVRGIPNSLPHPQIWGEVPFW